MPTRFPLTVPHLMALAADPRSDAGLVADFLHNADQGAFAELVRRHGPTVFGVCRRLLGPTPDAEDAFQATFLVLVRRARSTEWRASLGPWLYGVALKVARKARAARARQRTNERQATAMSVDSSTPSEDPTDTAAVIDEELAALPAIYRLPVVLCAIQGLSRRDAAGQLGLTEGTLSSRLARGRKLLRERLVRRGVTPVVAGLVVAVPTGLASATVHNAIRLLKCTDGAVPAGILSLTEGVVKTMIVKPTLAAGLVAVCIGLTAFGAWHNSAAPAAAADPPTTPLTPPKSPEPNPPPAAPKPDEPVATIFGDMSVSREEFADYLIQRHGKKELENFVAKQIIAQAFKEKGWALTPAEVAAALDADCRALGLSRKAFAERILPRYNKTLAEWTEDIVTPRLMLARLCKEKLPGVTEAELREAFKTKFGEKVKCRVVFWKKGEQAEARKAYERIRDSEEEFAAQARRSSKPELAATGSNVPPIPRNPAPDADAATLAAAKLQVGEVSPIVETPEGYVVLKCDAVIPADKSRSFEEEKPKLLAEVIQARIDREIPKLFQQLKRQAAPKYHLTFPDPSAFPTAIPPKKP